MTKRLLAFFFFFCFLKNLWFEFHRRTKREPESVTRARFKQTEFVVMHGHSCLSGLVTERGRGGGHKEEEGMPVAAGCIAGRSFITLLLSLLCTICSSIALHSGEVNRSETKEHVSTRGETKEAKTHKQSRLFKSSALHEERLHLPLLSFSGGREVKKRRFQIGSEVIPVAEAEYSQALASGRGGHQVTSLHRRHYNDPVCRSPTGRQAAVR